MAGRAIYRRYVYRSRFHPLPRRPALPFAFPGTEQPKPEATPGNVASRARSLSVIRQVLGNRAAFPIAIVHKTTEPPPPDTSDHVWNPPPARRAPRFDLWRLRDWHPVRRQVVRVLPPAEDSTTFEGALLGDLKVEPFLKIDDMLAEATYAGSLGVNLEKLP